MVLRKSLLLVRLANIEHAFIAYGVELTCFVTGTEIIYRHQLTELPQFSDSSRFKNSRFIANMESHNPQVEPVGKTNPHDLPRVSVSAELVFTSAVGPLDANAEVIGKDDFAAQVQATLENLRRVLEQAGAQLKDAIKINWYLSDMRLSDVLYQERRRLLGNNEPATAVIPVPGFGVQGLYLQADAVALIPEE